jgi:hypothetical protein
LFPGRLLCVSAGTLQSELQATGGEKKEDRNAQRSHKTKCRKSRDKKKIERNRGQIKEGEITLGRETLKIILLSV